MEELLGYRHEFDVDEISDLVTRTNHGIRPAIIQICSDGTIMYWEEDE